MSLDPQPRPDLVAEFANVRHRAPIVRTGERGQIPFLVRQLVYRRDGWACQRCGATPHARTAARRSGPLHLDHIVPWSAGGSDRSDNLRTYCERCNLERSNFLTGAEQSAMPIVRICLPCNPRIAPWDIRRVQAAVPTMTVYCGRCSSESWTIATAEIL